MAHRGFAIKGLFLDFLSAVCSAVSEFQGPADAEVFDAVEARPRYPARIGEKLRRAVMYRSVGSSHSTRLEMGLSFVPWPPDFEYA